MESTTNIDLNNLLDNVIKKLQLFMNKHNETLLGLSNSIGFAYQPVYRLFKKKNFPTAHSLCTIAKFLKCSVSELVDEKVFVDVLCYKIENNQLKPEDSSIEIRAYLNYEDLAQNIHSEFFALFSVPLNGNQRDKLLNANKPNFQLFHKVNSLYINGKFLEGKYLVAQNNELRLLKVLSINSKYIIIEENGEEIKVNNDTIRPIARHLNYLIICDDRYLTGVNL